MYVYIYIYIYLETQCQKESALEVFLQRLQRHRN